MVAHTVHPITWKVGAGGPRVQGHPQLHTEFQAGSIRPYLKTNKQQKEKEDGPAVEFWAMFLKNSEVVFHKAGVENAFNSTDVEVRCGHMES